MRMTGILALCAVLVPQVAASYGVRLSAIPEVYWGILPHLASGLIAAGFIVFVYAWNEFIIAVSLASKQDMRLISVGLYFYLSEFGIEWGKIAASAMLSLLPPAVLFFILQRHLIHGLSAGAVK